MSSFADNLYFIEQPAGLCRLSADQYSPEKEGLKGVSPSRTLKDKVDMAVILCFLASKGWFECGL